MARPTSKYFTPVIKKILEAKKAENIVVDQEFKNVLRSQILSKINAAPVRKEVVRERQDLLPEKQSFDFAEFFNKFRYPLAIVPSMLLLVVVAMSAMKLPVSIKNEVTVPTPTPLQNENTQNNDATNSSDNFENTNTSGSQKVKTFSGSTVLPSSYRNGGAANSASNVISNPQNLNFDLNDSVSNQAPQATVNQKTSSAQQAPAQKITSQPEQTNQNVNPFNFVVQSFLESQPQDEPENNDNSSNVSNESFDVQPVQKQAEFTQAAPVQQLVQTNVQPQIEAVQTVPAVQPSVLENAQKNTQPAQNDAQKVQLNTVQPQIDVPAQQLVQTVSQPLQNTDLQLNMNTVNQQTPVVQVPLKNLNVVPKYTVFYTADIAESEKASFETEALAAVSGKEVSFMDVMSGTDDNVVEVSYSFADGTTATKLFKRLDGVWRSAKYVQRYFYDGGLQYNVSN